MCEPALRRGDQGEKHARSWRAGQRRRGRSWTALLINKQSAGMLVITFRPEFHPPWGDRSHVMNMALNR
jgi:hypothetical protein